MVVANVKIIEELKLFLDIVSCNPEIKSVFTQSPADFTRNRKLTIERVVGLIINLPKRTLSAEIQDFFDLIGQSSETATKGAFCLQRAKLNHCFFSVWNTWLVKNFYQYYGAKVKRWRGFRLLAVDGSTAYLLNNKEVIEHFGTQDNQRGRVPMARVFQVYDVLNKMIVFGGIHPIKESERKLLINEIDRLYDDSLIICDRGFPSYSLIYLLNNHERPRNFIMRCSVTFNRNVKAFLSSKKRSQVVEINPSKEAIEQMKQEGYHITTTTTIKVRMVKVKLSTGKTEVLLTNLYDEKKYTIADLAHLYKLRWGIETGYGSQKNQLQMEQFSGHKVICIRQDFGAMIFVKNLQSLIEKQSDEYLEQITTERKYQYKINHNVGLASLKNNIVKLFLENDPENLLLKLQKMFERNIEPIRPGRHNPRIKKARRLNGKYQTFTNYKRAI